MFWLFPYVGMAPQILQTIISFGGCVAYGAKLPTKRRNRQNIGCSRLGQAEPTVRNHQNIHGFVLCRISRSCKARNRQNFGRFALREFGPVSDATSKTLVTFSGSWGAILRTETIKTLVVSCLADPRSHLSTTKRQNGCSLRGSRWASPIQHDDRQNFGRVRS